MLQRFDVKETWHHTNYICNLSVYTEFVRTTPVNIEYAWYRELSRFSS